MRMGDQLQCERVISIDANMQLAKQDPINTKFQRDISVLHLRLGDICLQSELMDCSLSHYQTSLKIDKQLVEQDSINTGFRMDLSDVYVRLGKMYLIREKMNDAQIAFKASLLILKELAEKDPDNTVIQRGLAVSYFRMFELLGRMKKYRSALTYIEKARELFVQMDKNITIEPNDKLWIESANKFIAKLKKALGD